MCGDDVEILGVGGGADERESAIGQKIELV